MDVKGGGGKRDNLHRILQFVGPFRDGDLDEEVQIEKQCGPYRHDCVITIRVLSRADR